MPKEEHSGVPPGERIASLDILRGFALFGKFGAAQALLVGVAVYVAQMIFSAWWLGRYRYGPLEWLWRTLMYGESQPMRIQPRAS